MNGIMLLCQTGQVSTHSRPKAAEIWLYASIPVVIVSTHSRPKAAEYFAYNLLTA